MKVSLNVTNYSWPDGPAQLASRLTSLATAAEDGGLDTIWVNDHLLQADPGAGSGERDMLEAYVTLSFLTGTTTRIGLGAMVSAISYRAPALLIKAVTTLDVLSGGRVQRRQAAKFADRDAETAATRERAYEQASGPEAQPAAPAAPPAASSGDMLEQLKTLGELKAQGVLTEEEFAQQKARILAG